MLSVVETKKPLPVVSPPMLHRGINSANLSGYLERIKSASARKDYQTARKLGEWCRKNINRLCGTPQEKYLLHCYLGHIYYRLVDYSHSLDAFYQADRLVARYRLSPVEHIRIATLCGHNLVSINAVSQALRQFQKAETYYHQYQKQIDAEDKMAHFILILGQAHCYLSKNNLPAVQEIIAQKMRPDLPLITANGAILDYYHLKGEYEVAIGQYDHARQSFRQAIETGEQIRFPRGVLEARMHLGMIDLLTGQLETARVLLSQIYRAARSLKLNNLICESALLLSKYYLLKNQPARAAALERRIKPLLKKVDLVWIYEKARELDNFYRQIDHATVSHPTTPGIINQAINQYYEVAAGKELVIGNSPAMREIWQLVEKIAPTGLPVLIQGETGVGKELIANAIHQHSGPNHKLYLAFNCGTVPETLIESHLFGYKKGAFTDAKENKKGHIELASSGTLFIDEIGDMSPAMQQKLLRVMEEKQVWPLGAEKPVSVDTRFVFASNQNIEEMVKHKRFREDLFYRINTIVINLPPLRDRKDDIPLLIQHFLAKYAKTQDAQRTTQDARPITPDALALLVAYPWPGNIRELENEIKRFVALYPDEPVVKETMLSAPIRTCRINKDLVSGVSGNGLTLKEMECRLIKETLHKCSGNITHAARQLGCSRRGLHKKLRKYHL